MLSESPLVDLGTHPEIFADGIGDVLIVEPNAHLILFRWRKLDGVLQRCIAAELIRPVCSFTHWQLAAWQETYPHIAQLAVH